MSPSSSCPALSSQRLYYEVQFIAHIVCWHCSTSGLGQWLYHTRGKIFGKVIIRMYCLALSVVLLLTVALFGAMFWYRLPLSVVYSTCMG